MHRPRDLVRLAPPNIMIIIACKTALTNSLVPILQLYYSPSHPPYPFQSPAPSSPLVVCLAPPSPLRDFVAQFPAHLLAVSSPLAALIFLIAPTTPARSPHLPSPAVPVIPILPCAVVAILQSCSRPWPSWLCDAGSLSLCPLPACLIPAVT